MSEPTKYRQYGKGHVFNVLRREIQAARLKVTLDEELGRPTSEKVKRLAAMDLPRIVRPDQHAENATSGRTYDPTNKGDVFDTLRREILAARLKVSLDQALDRETSPTVKRLAQMKLPPIIRSNDVGQKVTYRRTYDPTNREQVLSILRREIRAARLKVTLDKKLERETSPQVKLLAEMSLPPIVRRHHRAGVIQADAVARTAAEIHAGRRQPVAADEVKRQPRVSDAEVPAAAEPDTVEGTGSDNTAGFSPEERADQSAPAAAEPAAAAPDAAPAAAPVTIEPAEVEHSGHVTLYLPKDLNQWLTEHHDKYGISYPGIILNAISWAADGKRLAEIFAPVDSPIPANDIFGRAPVLPKPARGSVEPETRPVRFRKDHMQVIIGLAHTWTADNRNAFFVGTLTAYRDQQNTQ